MPMAEITRMAPSAAFPLKSPAIQPSGTPIRMAAIRAFRPSRTDTAKDSVTIVLIARPF